MLKFVLTSFPKDLYHANYVLAGMEFLYRFSEHKDCWGVWDTQAGASEVYQTIWYLKLHTLERQEFHFLKAPVI